MCIGYSLTDSSFLIFSLTVLIDSEQTPALLLTHLPLRSHQNHDFSFLFFSCTVWMLGVLIAYSISKPATATMTLSSTTLTQTSAWRGTVAMAIRCGALGLVFLVNLILNILILTPVHSNSSHVLIYEASRELLPLIPQLCSPLLSIF